jgi:hypothetical protein
MIRKFSADYFHVPQFYLIHNSSFPCLFSFFSYVVDLDTMQTPCTDPRVQCVVIFFNFVLALKLYFVMALRR